jgi:hypothetical protein
LILLSVVADCCSTRPRVSYASVAAFHWLRDAHTMQDRRKRYITRSSSFVLPHFGSLRNTSIVVDDGTSGCVETAKTFVAFDRRSRQARNFETICM